MAAALQQGRGGSPSPERAPEAAPAAAAAPDAVTPEVAEPDPAVAQRAAMVRKALEAAGINPGSPQFEWLQKLEAKRADSLAQAAPAQGPADTSPEAPAPGLVDPTSGEVPVPATPHSEEASLAGIAGLTSEPSVVVPPDGVPQA